MRISRLQLHFGIQPTPTQPPEEVIAALAAEFIQRPEMDLIPDEKHRQQVARLLAQMQYHRNTFVGHGRQLGAKLQPFSTRIRAVLALAGLTTDEKNAVLGLVSKTPIKMGPASGTVPGSKQRTSGTAIREYRGK